MARFQCRIGTSAGEVLSQEMEAPSERALRTQLEDKGYYVFALRPARSWQSLLEGFSFRKQRVGAREFILFNQEFCALLKAGLPVLTALELLLSRKRGTHFEQLLEIIKEEVRSGAALSEAFANRGDVFPKMYAATLASGERSGELVAVIQRYLFYLNTAQGVKKKVVSAIIYPVILLTLAVGLIALMMTFVVPKFATIFAEGGGNLPFLTQAVMTLSSVFQVGWPLLIAIPVSVPLVLKFLRAKPEGRMWLDKVAFRVPFLGENLKRFNIANMCRTLGTLVRGGIPVVSALEVVAEAMNSEFYRVGLRQCRQLVLEGQSLWGSMEKTGIGSPLSIEMIEVGESTGSLAEMLDQVSVFYDEELTTAVERFVALLEPMLLVFMAVIVALIVLSVYMPLFSMYNQMNG